MLGLDCQRWQEVRFVATSLGLIVKGGKKFDLSVLHLKRECLDERGQKRAFDGLPAAVEGTVPLQGSPSEG